MEEEVKKIGIRSAKHSSGRLGGTATSKIDATVAAKEPFLSNSSILQDDDDEHLQASDLLHIWKVCGVEQTSGYESTLQKMDRSCMYVLTLL